MRVTLPIVGPGSQVEDETLAYMEMPRGMATYRAPLLPEREELGQLGAATLVLRSVLEALEAALAGASPEPIGIAGLSAKERGLVNQVLGEGEVSALVQVAGEPHPRICVQESVFAGVWRVLGTSAHGGPADTIEVAPVPRALREAARADAKYGVEVSPPDALGLMNAPSILAELTQVWRAGPLAQSHVVNLTLLPVTPDDHAVLDQALGRGSVTILSRGYGNCRIESTARPRTWRLTYYNSQDSVILSTVEVSDVPEVACAARQDFADSRARLSEVLDWLGAP
jgi:hydrogenase-1 operon protein HyaF